MKTDIVALKKLMVEKDIKTISELSKKTKVNRGTLASILSGKTQPSSSTMCALVSALDISSENAGAIFFN